MELIVIGSIACVVGALFLVRKPRSISTQDIIAQAVRESKRPMTLTNAECGTLTMMGYTEEEVAGIEKLKLYMSCLLDGSIGPEYYGAYVNKTLREMGWG